MSLRIPDLSATPTPPDSGVQLYHKDGVLMAQGASGVPYPASMAPPRVNVGVMRTRGSGMSFDVWSTSGYAAVQWWDGTVEIQGTGVPGSAISFSKAAAADNMEREAIFWATLNGSNAYLDTDPDTRTIEQFYTQSASFYNDFRGLTKLWSVIFDGGSQDRDQLLLPPSVRDLQLGPGEAHQTFNFLALPNLQNLWVFDSALEEINLNGHPSIITVSADNGSAKRFFAKNCPNLQDVYFSFVGLDEADVTGSNELRNFRAHGLKQATLDLSGKPQLREVKIDNSPNLTDLNLDGAFALSSVGADGCPNLVNISMAGSSMGPGYWSYSWGSISYSSSYGYWSVTGGVNFSGSALTTDKLYDLIAEVEDLSGSGYSGTIWIQDTPANPAGTLVDGATRTAAETIALAASKAVTIALTK